MGLMTTLEYPKAQRKSFVDHFPGSRIVDPYRWLEDPLDVERAAWVAAQRALTEAYVADTGIRDELRSRMSEVVDYPRSYPLVRQGPYLVSKVNSGCQDQLTLQVQRHLTGTPRVVFDPAVALPGLSNRLTAVSLSRDSKYLALGIATDGGEWEEYRVVDLTTCRLLDDRLRWVKCSEIAWHGCGFYYSRYSPPLEHTSTLTACNADHRVYYHRIGAAQDDDELIHADVEHPLRLHMMTMTMDEQWAILTTLAYGEGWPGNALHAASPSADHKLVLQPIVRSFQSELGIVDTFRGKLLVVTNHRAPNRRLVLIDPASPEEAAWRTVLPEREAVIESVRSVGRRLFVTTAYGGIQRLEVFSRAGVHLDDIPLPGPGSTSVIVGGRHDTRALWSYQSFTHPPTVYCYDIRRRTSRIYRASGLTRDYGRFTTEYLRFPARDGVSVPLFLVRRQGVSPKRSDPLLLQGYGGFGISQNPSFDPLLLVLLEQGVTYALACVRGGSEFGEAWHCAGMGKNKQTAIDDFIDAAEWLQNTGYTSAATCGIYGVSHGGLLVAGAMTQRPTLFRVALPVGGVLDMLRYHRFTMGWSWRSEFGSSEEADMVPVLARYSPIHNVVRGGMYPATLAVTSEHDDSVVPAHSYKFIATLQAKGAPPGPYLIRIDANSGHSPGNLSKALDQRADAYAFFLHNVRAQGDQSGGMVGGDPVSKSQWSNQAMFRRAQSS